MERKNRVNPAKSSTSSTSKKSRKTQYIVNPKIKIPGTFGTWSREALDLLDGNLSATLLHAYLVSNAPDWEIYPKKVCAAMKISIPTFHRLFSEIQKVGLGFRKKTKRRSQKDKYYVFFYRHDNQFLRRVCFTDETSETPKQQAESTTDNDPRKKACFTDETSETPVNTGKGSDDTPPETTKPPSEEAPTSSPVENPTNPEKTASYKAQKTQETKIEPESSQHTFNKKSINKINSSSPLPSSSFPCDRRDEQTIEKDDIEFSSIAKKHKDDLKSWWAHQNGGQYLWNEENLTAMLLAIKTYMERIGGTCEEGIMIAIKRKLHYSQLLAACDAICRNTSLPTNRRKLGLLRSDAAWEDRGNETVFRKESCRDVILNTGGYRVELMVKPYDRLDDIYNQYASYIKIANYNFFPNKAAIMNAVSHYTGFAQEQALQKLLTELKIMVKDNHPLTGKWAAYGFISFPEDFHSPSKRKTTA